MGGSIDRSAMNFFHRVVVMFVICFAASAISAPAAADRIKSSSPDKKPSATDDIAEEIFGEDTKKKRSQEVIMFGNQQNKPAGMVDDGLVRFAEKKSQKRQENDGAIADGQHDDDQNDTNREVAAAGVQQATSSNDNGLSNVGLSDAKDEADIDRQLENSDLNDEVDSHLLPEYLPDSRLDDLVDSAQSLDTEPSYLNRDWNEYNAGNRYYGSDDNIYRRRRRTAATTDAFTDRGNRRLIRKRSLLTPLDQLLNSRRGAGSGRWKRDIKLNKDDVVGMLGILAAAEAAKERQQNRPYGLTDLESAYLDSLSETRPAETDNLDTINRYLSSLDRYDNPVKDEQDNDVVLREVPDWTFLETREPNLQLRRRSKPFYPPVDYRSLGVIGVKKRSTSHYYPGMWGRFEAERKRGIFRQRESETPDFGEFRGRFKDTIGYDDGDDLMSDRSPNRYVSGDDSFVGGGDEGDDVNQRDEELYTLGELLNGNDVDDDGDDDMRPVYKRLI